MQPDHDHVDQLDPDERHQHAAEPPHQQVLAQQGVSAERLILNPLERDRNQQRE